MGEYNRLVEPEEVLDLDKSDKYIWTGKDVVIGVSQGTKSVGIVMMSTNANETQLVQSWLLCPKSKLLENTLQSDCHNYLAYEENGEIFSTRKAWVTSEFVADVIQLIVNEYDVNLQAVAYDPWNGGRLAEILAEEPFNAQTVSISQRSNEIFDDIVWLRKKIKRGGIKFRTINNLLSHSLFETKIDIENRSVKTPKDLIGVLICGLINSSALTRRIQERFFVEE